MWALFASAQTDTLQTKSLDAVTVTARQGGMLRMSGAENGMKIGQLELFKAACCNLGESFTTNPSVDVNYSDATTGAKQIRLLGLSGTYVQMLTENLPNLRGAAAPYALDYVPGAWMNSIQVSKGASSVKNGYESITGQINVEYLKPDADEGMTVNLYGNTLSRMEANADGNIHLGEHLSTEIMAHFQKDWGHHDENGDGFLDQPNVRQWNLMNRWKWQGGNYLFHGGLSMVREKREGGQDHHTMPLQPTHRYTIGVETERYEGYMKHAFILNPEHNTNIALMGNASLHKVDALYGHKAYGVDEKIAYAQLMMETNLTKAHNLSVGLSLNYDGLTQTGLNTVFPPSQLPTVNSQQSTEHETTPGIYAQYTLNLHEKLVAMAGVRADHSNLHGTFVTPRFHLKYVPHDIITLRFSAGKGYRTVHALAENHYLLASGRQLVIDPLEQEAAWNYGISSALYIPLWGKTLKLNAEYYHTHFERQAIIDYDSAPTLLRITNLRGRSYSNTFQVDATYPVLEGLELTAAYRLNDVKTTYGGKLMQKPLTSRYKGLVTLSYKTPLELWQVDVTLQMNGGGRVPGHEPFRSYQQLNVQLTRWFRHFSIYIGGENLTGFHQKQTIIDAATPWASTFDPTMVWGPVHGAVGYVGIRWNLNRL